MKNKFKVILCVSAAALLASCKSSLLNSLTQGDSSTSTSVTYDDGDNFDEDRIDTITEDSQEDTDTEMDEVSETEGEIETPSEYDSFTNDTLDKNGGKYYLKGTYSKINITAKKGSELYVFLDGATITSTEGIAFGSEKQVTLHLVILNDSVNTIKNDYVESESLTAQNAFHVKGDVYISGTGTLNVTSTVKSAIKVSKNLYFCGGFNVVAEAKSHAITAQSVSIIDTNLNLKSSEKDGINAECDGELSTYSTEQGFISIKDSTVVIDTYGDGIQAATFVNISGGSTNITTHGQFIAYSSSLITSGDYTSDDFKYQKSGNKYVRLASDEIHSLNSSYYALVNSVKGIKVAGVEYEDSNGNVKEVTTGDYIISIAHLAKVQINSTDDSIHTNYGDVILDSCNLKLDTYDDGVHADYDLTVNNTSIVIGSSYEGLEGGSVTINGEDTNIVTTSSDDGINAASDYVKTNNININAGYLRVFASGDGLDANTSLNINGGTVIVEGPGSNNGSLDADKVYINGGLVFACSTNGMRESTTVKQNTFVYQGSTMAANTLITVANSNNEALFSYTLKQSCTQLIFSSKDLTVGSSYKILSGSSVIATISQSSSLTQVGSSQGGGGPGGGGGAGGGPGGR